MDTYDVTTMANMSDVTMNSTSFKTASSDLSEEEIRICMNYDFAVEGVMMAILCLFGFCGNALSMICLSKDKSKTATPFLLVSLEAADTLFLVTVLILRVMNTISMYFDIYRLHGIWAYVGKYVYPFALMSETGTIYVTLLVTLNRYVSVCKPYDAVSMCSVPHARQHVLLVFGFSVLYNVPRFFEYDIGWVDMVIESQNVTVLRSYSSPLAAHRVYQILYVNIAYFIIMFLVPLMLLVFLNHQLIAALKETKRRRATLLSADARSEEDITRILIVVVLVFFFCQTPALITQVLGNMLSDDQKECHTVFFYYERFSDLLVVGNSSLNFIIYCFCSKKFREILKSLLCKKSSPESAATGRRQLNQRSETANNDQYRPVATNANTAANGNCASQAPTTTITPTTETTNL